MKMLFWRPRLDKFHSEGDYIPNVVDEWLD
jgi:hypothetical protein